MGRNKSSLELANMAGFWTKGREFDAAAVDGNVPADGWGGRKKEIASAATREHVIGRIRNRPHSITK